MKGKGDIRNYKYVKLKNGIRCMLISDDITELSACSINISAGYLMDPLDKQGLAHICEHMLTMGSIKYPKEGEYYNHIQLNGGRYNASTFPTYTDYFFSVSNSAYERALEYFSQFFKAPIFPEDILARELEAVDSEHHNNFSSEYRRIHQIMMEYSDPASLLHRFGTGNRDTLRCPIGELRKSIIEFFASQYTTNQ